MRKIVRYSLIALLLIAILAGIAVYFLYRASQHVPEFYTAELAVAPATQEKDSDVFIQKATTMHNDLQHSGAWEQVFTAKAINAWLAVDLPRNHSTLLPSGMSDPRVHIGPEGITAACQIDRYRFHGVV